MGMAGTPCPFLGEIGTAAAKKWVANPELIPEPIILETKQDGHMHLAGFSRLEGSG